MQEKSEYIQLIDLLRCNIIDWYPFDKEKSILNLSSNKKIQEYLISKKYNANISATEKYDYILFIGNLKENLDKIDDNLKYLKEDGKLLIAFDNYLSVKNFCIENEKEDFTKLQIENYLNSKEFIFQKIYYVFSDIQTTNVIFTDEYMINSENISRNIPFYIDEDVVVKSENELINKLLCDDKSIMKKFANAYFIETSKKKFEDNKIKFISYSNMRKNEYKIKTIIKGNVAYKMPLDEQGKKHFEGIKKNIDIMNAIGLKTIDRYEEDYIVSEFQNTETIDNILINKMKNNKIDDAKDLIRNYYKLLLKKLSTKDDNTNVFDKYKIEYKIKDIENLNFTKYGLWDLILQNSFLINNEFYFFDQEWMEENVPIEYIMYRAFSYCPHIEKYINLDELYKMVNINKKNVILFKKLDEILQQITKDNLAWKIHVNNRAGIKYEKNIEKICELEHNRSVMASEFNNLLNEKDARIKFLEDNIQENCSIINEKDEEIANLNEKLNLILNSWSWKLTKPLRKIKKIGDKI